MNFLSRGKTENQIFKYQFPINFMISNFLNLYQDYFRSIKLISYTFLWPQQLFYGFPLWKAVFHFCQRSLWSASFFRFWQGKNTFFLIRFCVLDLFRQYPNL